MPKKKNTTADGGLEHIRWVVLNLDDEREDIESMPAIEVGIYHRLKLAYIRNKGPLTNDKEQLYRLACTYDKKERQAVDAVLRKKFSLLADCCWQHTGCDDAINDANARHRVAVTKGKKGAETRWEKEPAGDSSAIPPAMAEPMPEECSKEVKKLNSKEVKTLYSTTFPSPPQGGKGNTELQNVRPPSGGHTSTTPDNVPRNIPSSINPTQLSVGDGQWRTPESVRDVEERVRQLRQRMHPEEADQAT